MFFLKLVSRKLFFSSGLVLLFYVTWTRVQVSGVGVYPSVGCIKFLNLGYGDLVVKIQKLDTGTGIREGYT